MRYKLFYIFFLIAILLYGNLKFGALEITPRQIMALAMFFVCIKVENGFKLNMISYLYLLFAFIFGISSLLAGTVSQYIHQLVGFYLVAIIACKSTSLLPQYDSRFIPVFFYTLLGIGFVNTMVTISQFLNLHWYESFINTLGILSEDKFEERKDLFANSDYVVLSIPGIFGTVTNGYYSLVCVVLSFYVHIYKRKLWTILLPLFFLLGLFLCQQRVSFVVACLMSTFLYYKVSGLYCARIRIVMRLLLVVILFFVANELVQFSNEYGLRYSSLGVSTTGRDVIYKNAQKYILSTPLFSNIYEYIELTGGMPHNLFLNAYMFGGIGSFFIIIFILFYQLKQILNVLLNPLSLYNYPYYLLGMAYVGFTINSLTHNESIVTGSTLLWLVWGGFVASKKQLL